MATVSISYKQPITTKRIQKENYGNVKFVGSKRISTIEEILPFRIKFTSIRIPSSNPANVPPIPLQIIGFSNYIL